MGADREALKRRAAEAALAFVEPGRLLGVGTGSTANHFIDLLGERFRGQVPGAVASSEASAARLRDHGFRVLELPDVPDRDLPLHVYVDGADEFAPDLSLIKGGGGALTREKIVAEASRTFVCVVDASKRVARLGAFPLPVEVIPMARGLVAKKLRALGGAPRLREGFTTDNHNVILDVAGLAIADPEGLEREIEAWPGVVCAGLFARRGADHVLMATPEGVERFDRP